MLIVFVCVCVCVLTAQECGIYTHRQCYPLAFGIPAGLMFVALGMRAHTLAVHKSDICTLLSSNLYQHSDAGLLCAVVFIAGSPMYTKMAPQGNIMVKFCKCVGVSVSW